MANPVFKNTKQFQSSATPVGFDVEQQPGINFPMQDNSDAMTYDGVLIKSASLFLVAVASAVLVGMFAPLTLVFPIAIAAFVMSLITMFAARKGPKPGLFAITVALYGGAAGGISALYEAQWGGIVLQALIATAVVFAVSLFLFKSGRVRNMNKIRKFLAIAVPSYVVFSLINVATVWFGGLNMREMNIPGTSLPIGIVISLFAITVGALMLISDFDFVDNGVRNALPASWEWTAAYGLVFSIIWIYIEMLRLLSYLRGR